jgi:hypothetical protein
MYALCPFYTTPVKVPHMLLRTCLALLLTASGYLSLPWVKLHQATFLQESGVAVPSSTILDGKFGIRVAITNHRSRREDFEVLVAAMVPTGKEVTVSRVS